MEKLTRPILLSGGSETCPEIYYKSGFKTVDPVVLLIKSWKEKYLLVSELELGRAQIECAGHRVKVLTPRLMNIKKKKKNGRESIIKMLKIANVKTIHVQSQFPYGLGVYLEKKNFRVVASQKDLFPERLVKTPDEVKKIKEVQYATVMAMKAAVSEIAGSKIGSGGELRIGKQVVTSEYIREVIGKCLLGYECVSRDIIVACGKDSANPHCVGTGPLYASQPIIIDIYPKSMKHGYWGDLTRTVVKGPADAKLKKMYNAVKAAQSAALSNVKSGVKCATVDQAVVDEFEKRKCRTTVVDGRMEGFIHSTGHGVGLEIHERPAMSRLSDEKLRAGNIITIEPGLYYSDIGGMRIEDTIEVVSGGWRYLAPCEKKLFLQ